MKSWHCQILTKSHFVNIMMAEMKRQQPVSGWDCMPGKTAVRQKKETGDEYKWSGQESGLPDIGYGFW